MKFPQALNVFLVLIILSGVFLLVGCSSTPSTVGFGSSNPIPQRQEGIKVGLSIYDPNRPTQQAQLQNKELAGVTVISPDLSKPLKSPVTVHGKVSGVFFSEGVFPIVLQDSKGVEIARTLAHADDEWMTEDVVPFTAVLTFTSAEKGPVHLVFMKDNSSGLPENDLSKSFVVTFE